MIRTRSWALAALAVVTSLGCASVKVHPERIDKVKTVALVGFSGQLSLHDPNEKKDSKGIGATINAIKNIGEMGSGELQKRRTEQAEKAYSLLAKKLSEQMGWRVLDAQALAQSPVYATQLREHSNEGLTTLGLQYLPNVLRAEVAERLSPSQRDELIKSLGVDAVAVVAVKYVVGDKSGFSLGGVGKQTTYPKAVVGFAVWDQNAQEAAWSDRWAEGKPTTEGLAATMGVELDENETSVLLAAADSGYGRLLVRYQEQAKKAP